MSYYEGDQVQYHGSAYQATATATSRDRPGQGDPWDPLGICETGGGGGDLQPLSIYGVWHCGNHYCDWSEDPPDISDEGEFDQLNHWIIDRGDGTGLPSVNLVVLSFLEPLELLNQTTNDAFVNGIPIGMTKPDGMSTGPCATGARRWGRERCEST